MSPQDCKTKFLRGTSLFAVFIATRHAGIPEHIRENENGVLVDEHNVDQFAGEISRLVQDAALSNILAENARNYAVGQLDYRVLLRRLEVHIERQLARS